MNHKSKSPTRRLGPFAGVPRDAVKPAGFKCPFCRRKVEKFAVLPPAMVVRMMFYACRCGTVTCWEDEKQPRDSEHWGFNVEFLKSVGADVVMFNGDKPLDPSFSGIN